MESKAINIDKTIIIYMVLQKHDSKIFEWVCHWYFSENLPRCFPYMDNGGKVLDHRGNPIRPGRENPHLDHLLVIYDGDTLLNKVHELITDDEEELSKPVVIDSLEGFLSDVRLNEQTRDNDDDVTRFYNHRSGQMTVAYSPLRNYYAGTNEKQLIEKGLPLNFMSPDGDIPRTKIGKATRASLLATDRFRGRDGLHVNAVLAKTTEYFFGGKVVLFSEGRLLRERYAKAYDPVSNYLQCIECHYEPASDGVVVALKETKHVPVNPEKAVQYQLAA